MISGLKAPFPYFGGKRKVAPLVWERFGDVPNYCEPFCGSMAVLLARPTDPRVETVNDVDCMITNVWRAIAADPEGVAHWADWPVSETDLHARHLWLVNQITPEFTERMRTEHDFYDVKMAGFWLWGIACWIGSGWCARPEWSGRVKKGKSGGIHGEGVNKRPLLSGHSGGLGVHKKSIHMRQEPPLDENGQATVWRKRPWIGRGERGVSQQLPDLGGDSGAVGRGIHASGLPKKIPRLCNSGHPGEAQGIGVLSDAAELSGIEQWFMALAQRLRRVRVTCGDWKRIVGPAVTTCIGVTGVFLDPPYAVEDRADVYNEECREVAHEVRRWAIENGDNPDMRIALCGYDEHDEFMPASWEKVRWKANGGYSNQGTQGGVNSRRETIYFNRACIRERGLFDLPEEEEEGVAV